jgi:hypothetical protein
MPSLRASHEPTAAAISAAITMSLA